MRTLFSGSRPAPGSVVPSSPRRVETRGLPSLIDISLHQNRKPPRHNSPEPFVAQGERVLVI